MPPLLAGSADLCNPGTCVLILGAVVAQVRAALCDFYDSQASTRAQESVWVESAPGEAGLLQWAGGPQVRPSSTGRRPAPKP